MLWISEYSQSSSSCLSQRNCCSVAKNWWSLWDWRWNISKNLKQGQLPLNRIFLACCESWMYETNIIAIYSIIPWDWVSARTHTLYSGKCMCTCHGVLLDLTCLKLLCINIWHKNCFSFLSPPFAFSHLSSCSSSFTPSSPPFLLAVGDMSVVLRDPPM